MASWAMAQDDGVNPNWAAVSGLSGGVVAVSAGDAHALALTSDGSVWAWGGNGGQLGNGTTTASAVRVQVPGLTGIVAVSAGSDVSVALRSDGTVWNWAAITGGDLGDGTTIASSMPVPVTGLAGDADRGRRELRAGAAFGRNRLDLGSTRAASWVTGPLLTAACRSRSRACPGHGHLGGPGGRDGGGD